MAKKTPAPAPAEPEFRIVVRKTSATDWEAKLYQHGTELDTCYVSQGMESTDAMFNFGVFHMKNKRPNWDEFEFVFDPEEGHQLYVFLDPDEEEREDITDFVVEVL